MQYGTIDRARHDIDIVNAVYKKVCIRFWKFRAARQPARDAPVQQRGGRGERVQPVPVRHLLAKRDASKRDAPVLADHERAVQRRHRAREQPRGVRLRSLAKLFAYLARLFPFLPLDEPAQLILTQAAPLRRHEAHAQEPQQRVAPPQTRRDRGWAAGVRDRGSGDRGPSVCLAQPGAAAALRQAQPPRGYAWHRSPTGTRHCVPPPRARAPAHTAGAARIGVLLRTTH